MKQTIKKIITALCVMSIFVTQTGLAETKSPSCRDVIKACDETIASKNKALEISNLAIKEAQKQVGDLTTQVNDKNEQLSAWYRNPFILGMLGVLAGGLATAIVIKR
jgi:peptidoglycan hydrolase CwlO-like protein